MTFGLEAFMEKISAWKSRSRAILANSRALSTMPSGESPKRFMIRSLSEPWLVPMRIATPRSMQSFTSGVKRSRIRSNSAAYSASL